MTKSTKKLGKLNLIEKETKTYSRLSDGALDPNYYIKAQMKNKTWQMAKIIDCRLKKDLDPSQKKISDSYEYYVHYVDFNRRMDEWISRPRIELTRKLIEEEFPTKKKNQEKRGKESRQQR